MPNLLSSSFLEQYKLIQPKHKGILFEITRLRYAISIPDGESTRLEKWWETCARQVEYSFSNYSGHKSPQELIPEAEEMFDLMFHLYSMPSGRSMRIGGTKAGDLCGEANFNCTALNIEKLSDFCEVFHLSLASCGVGFGITTESVSQLPKLTYDFITENLPYKYVGYTDETTEATSISYIGAGEWLIKVGDSKNGWVKALEYYLSLLEATTYTRRIVLDYSFVRPEGEKLKTWGGRAAGPEGLMSMFSKLSKIIRRSKGRLRPIDVLDINTIIGKNVVSGGTRRAAMIALFSPGDQECIEAKAFPALGWYTEKGKSDYLDFTPYSKENDPDGSLWKEDLYEGKVEWYPNPETEHRTMSNNTMVFDSKPSFEELRKVFKAIEYNGEPGFFNRQAASKRRPNALLLNPCSEIILDSKGVCNLSTSFLPSHIIEKNGKKDVNWTLLERSVRNATRIGLRQTNVTLSLPEWDLKQKRDRLLGVSLTGQMDGLDTLGWKNCGPEHRKLLQFMGKIANDEADRYSFEMRVPRPLLVTAVKPEGSLSLLTTVSWGCHRAWAPYYVRRMKFAKFDPVCKALMKLGVPWEKDKTKKESNRIVFTFPIASGASMKSSEESFRDQFSRYLLHQEVYTDHNTSCTLYVGKDEWEEACQLVYDNWSQVIAVSFLPKQEGTYVQAPNESISKEEYEKLSKLFPDLSTLTELVDMFESGKHEEYEILDEACAGGACPLI